MKKDISKNTVEFTKDQYEILMKLVYLGGWMVNSNRAGDEIIEEYEQIEDLIFSQAEKFGLKKYVHHEESDGNRYFPTRQFEEKSDVNDLRDEYDDAIFWDELVDRLGEREFVEKYGETVIKKMDRDERFEKLYECIDKYEEELANHGINRLRIAREGGAE